MNSKDKAILTLQIVCVLTVLVGLIGFVAGIVANESIPMMGITVPAWVVGASVAYMGFRYWRKIPDIRKNMTADASFSWSNFRSK